MNFYSIEQSFLFLFLNAQQVELIFLKIYRALHNIICNIVAFLDTNHQKLH